MKAPTRTRELIIVLLSVVDIIIFTALGIRAGLPYLSGGAVVIGGLLTVLYIIVANRAIRHAQAVDKAVAAARAETK